MRLDKFLKVSRLVKRRSVAKVLADKDKFIVNKKIAKPSTDVKINDEVELYLGRHHIVITIKEIKENALISDANKMYEIIKDEILED